MKLPDIEQLSHATLITGNRANNLDRIKSFLLDQNITIVGNPDIFIFNEEQLFMDQAKSIVEMLTSQKVSTARFCIISCDRIASDVQNTLLKTIEEPQVGTYIMMVLPNTDNVLLTIMSRCQILGGDETIGNSRLSVDEFLKKSVPERFIFIESWTKNKKDEDNVSKTEVLNFINALEKKVWETVHPPTPSKRRGTERLFSDIQNMRDYTSLRGSSHRIILDFLAMICPKQ